MIDVFAMLGSLKAKLPYYLVVNSRLPYRRHIIKATRHLKSGGLECLEISLSVSPILPQLSNLSDNLIHCVLHSEESNSPSLKAYSVPFKQGMMKGFCPFRTPWENEMDLY